MHIVILFHWQWLYIRFEFALGLAISSSDITCLPISEAEMLALNGSTAENLVSTMALRFFGQVNTGDAFFYGMVPEYLMLYDFSGEQTTDSGQRIPGIALKRLPYHNQFNDGISTGLPKRFRGPGGNACGPCSLAMALAYYNVPTTIRDVYNNTMQQGLYLPPNSGNPFPDDTEQAFCWWRAKAWLKGSSSRKGISFQPTISSSFRAPLVREIAKIGWQEVEAELHAGNPVLISTKLSERPDPAASKGHVILLLGTGTNEYIGEYFIVSDPAGHYYANPKGNHYGTVEALFGLCLGVSHGGWFAMYPKTSLEFKAKGLCLTLASKSTALIFEAHSPLDFYVSDPAGRRSGVLETGFLAEEIPKSSFLIPVAEEEESDYLAYDLEAEKTLVVLDPRPGLYTAILRGTNSGPYSLDMEQIGTGGVVVHSETSTGTIAPQQTFTYSTTNLQEHPFLEISAGFGLANISLFGSPGKSYRLENSPNLNSWEPVATNSSSTGFISFQDVSPQTTKFFRAKGLE
jgi:hypothetical protein